MQPIIQVSYVRPTIILERCLVYLVDLGLISQSLHTPSFNLDVSGSLREMQFK